MAAGVMMCWTASSISILDRVNILLYENLQSVYSRVVLGAIGAVLCLLALAALVRLVGPSEPSSMKRSIVFASSLGEVRVAIDTVERYLSRVGIDVPDVQKLIPQVQGVDEGNRVSVDATVHVTLGRNVREVSEQIAEHIATQLKSILGVTEVGNINVNVREVQPPETGRG